MRDVSTPLLGEARVIVCTDYLIFLNHTHIWGSCGFIRCFISHLCLFLMARVIIFVLLNISKQCCIEEQRRSHEGRILHSTKHYETLWTKRAELLLLKLFLWHFRGWIQLFLIWSSVFWRVSSSALTSTPTAPITMTTVCWAQDRLDCRWDTSFPKPRETTSYWREI